MDISDQLLCLFNAELEEQNDSYVVEVPERELSIGDLQEREVYRVGVFQSASTGREAKPEPESEPTEPSQAQEQPEPPVKEGEFREVEITDIGDQGDGIARTDRGFVVIVPDTDLGDQVTVEITHVQGNYAVGEIVHGQKTTR